MKKAETARSYGDDLKRMMEDKRAENDVTSWIRELDHGIAFRKENERQMQDFDRL